MSQVRVENLRRVFEGGVAALEGVSVEIQPGEFVAILGPSGCGKSTLLRIIAGLDRPSGGSVEVARGAIAYVFQDAHLLPWRNVLRNVELPLELMGLASEKRRAAAREALAGVGLSDVERRYPNQLSGGMRMRVSIARAMALQPQILLMDEPFAALDEITRQKLDEQLRQLWAARGMTVLFVTHSTTEAVYLANRAVVLSPRPGRVVQDREVALPRQRPGGIRGSAEFAEQTRILFDALRRGEDL